MQTKALIKSFTIVIIVLTSVGVFLHKRNVFSINNVAVTRQKTELPVANNFALINAVRNGSLLKLEKNDATVKCLGGKNEDRMRANINLLNEIQDGPLKSVTVQPGDLPTTVHYVWCGRKQFLFEHFLGFLSFVRITLPVKILFHYNELPQVSDYRNWFAILTQSLPQLMLRKTDKRLRCDTVDVLSFALEQLAASPGGGIYFGERTALTYIPSNWKTDDYISYIFPGSTSGELTVVYTKFGLVNINDTLEDFKSKLLSKAGVCVDAHQFNKEMMDYEDVRDSSFPDDIVSPCVVLPKEIYPKDIINVDTPFAANFRRIFYGKSDLLVAKPSQDPNDLIPLISHYVYLAEDPNKRPEWTFFQYISILSAIYVAGFERVYLHCDQIPTGKWWDKLQTENITFVFIEKVETIYQHKVEVPAHQTDILRLMVLLKYGGVYQDSDVIWGNPLAQELRRYSTVMSYDWAIHQEWPRAFSNGLIMSKAKSPFLQKFLDSYWLQKDDQWAFNGVEMPYKVYELNPEDVYVYDKLQVICHINICHPTWHSDHLRPWGDLRKPTRHFSLDEGLAYHFARPEPYLSLVSFRTIKNGTDIAAQVGKRVLRAVEKANRIDLLV